MSKKWSVVIGIGVLLSVLSFQNCGGKSANSGQTAQGNSSVTVNATVMKSNIDGCNYILCANGTASNGSATCYLPMGMDPALLVDGNVVAVNGTLVYGVDTICMAGQPLQVNSATLSH